MASSARAVENIQKAMIQAKKGLAAEAKFNASRSVLEAATKASNSKGFRNFDELANPAAKFERITKSMEIADKNAHMLKMAMGVNESAKRAMDPAVRKTVGRIGRAIAETDVTAGMPVLPKELFSDYPKTILGQTAMDSLGLKGAAGIDKASLVAGFGWQGNEDMAALATRRAVLPGLPKEMLDKNYDDKYSTSFAVAPLVALDMNPNLSGLPKSLLERDFYVKTSSDFVRATMPAILGATQAFPGVAMESLLRDRIKDGFEVSNVIRAAMRINSREMERLHASIFAGAISVQSMMRPFGGTLTVLERNRKLMETVFAVSNSGWNTAALADFTSGLPSTGFPFEDEPGRVWTPADIWTDLQDYVDRVLRDSADLSEPTVVELLSKYLYASAVVANVGPRKAIDYVTWVAASLAIVLFAAGAAIDDPSFLTLYCLYLSLRPMDEPAP